MMLPVWLEKRIFPPEASGPMEVNLKGCTTCEKGNHGSLRWMQWTTLLWSWSWWDAPVTIPKMALWGPPWAESSNIVLDRLLSSPSGWGIQESFNPLSLSPLWGLYTHRLPLSSMRFPPSPLTSFPRAPRPQRGCSLAL